MSFNADIILGALLVGTWTNSVLYTVEITQAAYYYRHFKHDSWMLKLLVSSTIAIDSVSMIANYASVYLYTITHWGDSAYLKNQYWASHFGPIGRNIIEHMSPNSLTLSTSLRLAQWPLWPKLSWLGDTGFCARLYHCGIEAQLLTRSRTRNKFITLALFFFITVALGGAFASAVTIAIFPKYSDRKRVIERITIPATTWLVAEAVTDISIAFALLLQLRKVKSSFKETRGLLDKLVTQTIQTGAAGATIALAVLVTFLANNASNVPTGIAYCIGRVYCLTMLANLNRRKTESAWSSKGTLSGASPETRGERGTQERSEGGDDYGGIHVHRTAVVHIETPQGFSRGSLNTDPSQGLPGDRPAVAMEMKVNDSDSYSSKKNQDLFDE
ncbi:hypothetical protein DFH08DRAFT_955474 [Mycena albidolilacea]|uniref:DUF6534 domain-containing protein n=1 Tax=Mycena albidolilacea TaxID=1033008 RepID=A0AAD7EY24_9AGAR|nr:hypothetical protein DFH08DRAFT_955474 [Mycena albidolilacea]